MTLTKDFLTAAQAKQLAEEANKLEGQYLRKETLEILAQIQEVASTGRSSVTIYRYNHQIIVDRLISLGYTVNVRSGSSQRDDTSSLTITW